MAVRLCSSCSTYFSSPFRLQDLWQMGRQSSGQIHSATTFWSELHSSVKVNQGEHYEMLCKSSFKILPYFSSFARKIREQFSCFLTVCTPPCLPNMYMHTECSLVYKLSLLYGLLCKIPYLCCSDFMAFSGFI